MAYDYNPNMYYIKNTKDSIIRKAVTNFKAFIDGTMELPEKWSFSKVQHNHDILFPTPCYSEIPIQLGEVASLILSELGYVVINIDFTTGREMPSSWTPPGDDGYQTHILELFKLRDDKKKVVALTQRGEYVLLDDLFKDKKQTDVVFFYPEKTSVNLLKNGKIDLNSQEDLIKLLNDLIEEDKTKSFQRLRIL